MLAETSKPFAVDTFATGIVIGQAFDKACGRSLFVTFLDDVENVLKDRLSTQWETE